MPPNYTFLKKSFRDVEDLSEKKSRPYRYLGAITAFCLTNIIFLSLLKAKHDKEPYHHQHNVIMMISDGFGPASETFARQYYAWKENLPAKTTFALDKIIVGTSRTQSSSSLITDSAAGATAFACGIKTYNGAIGVDRDKIPCGTVLESAKIHRNMKTGLVVKSRITHATPAAFSAHISWRDAENDIAEHQLGYTPLGRTVDLMLGGGLCEFLSNTTEGSCRMDDRDLIQEGKEDFGWTTIRSRQEFDQLDESQVELPLMGLFAPNHMDFAIDNNPSVQPSLTEMTEKALGILKESTKHSKEGFFLMIEGSRIDMAGHVNDPASQYYEILEYQRTVESVMKFVEKNPNTILISTSDHETGGLTVGRQVTEDYPKYEWKPEVIERVKVSSEVLSWVWSEAVQNKQDTREYLVNFVIKLGLGIDDPTEEELERLLAWKETGRGPEYFALILSDLVSKRAQIGWSTMGHTATDVNLYAYGLKSELLRGNLENTDIGDFIVDLLNLDLDDITKKLNGDSKFRSKSMSAIERSNSKDSNHYIHFD